jgi:mono/diheme cytochrome c family protein
MGRKGWSVLMAGALLVLGATKAGAQTSLTYTKDIAPIFQEQCQSCHRPGYIAPMSLVTYEEVRPWVRSIRTRVAARQMPPWHIDRTVGIQSFKNDRSLTDDELEAVLAWIDAGAPKGDPRDMPAPKQFANDDVWNFADVFGGPPDLIIKSTPYTMPALAQDHWWKPEVPTGLTEDRWIRGIEIRPSTVPGRRITHHALARLQQDETDPLALGAASDVGAGLLMEARSCGPTAAS